MTMRWKIAAAGLTFAVTCAGLLGNDLLGPLPAHARPQRDAEVDAVVQGKDNRSGPTPVYYGTAACSNKGCHGGEPPTKWVVGRDLITRGNEAITYSMHDKHADAFKVLKGKRGQQMTKLLGYDVTKAKACLACHSTVVEDKSLLAASAENHFSVEEGVSCVTCHGAYEEWVSQHGVMVAARKFRKLTPEQKERDYGLANLRDPVRQSELCVSCHVGNIEQGKFVTHEMYAAGHPPLPSFEIATFAEQSPRHWQYRREKSPALQKELGLRTGELEQTQLVIIGALTAFRESMRLLVAQGREASQSKDPDKKTLDLSNFDCWSCHHGIRSPSWRQERGYDGTPGRPTWRSWPAELVPAALDHLAVADTKFDVAAARTQFDDKLKALKKAFDAKVYGNPADVEKAAKDLAAWSDSTIVRTRGAFATADSAKSMLAKMPARYGTRGNDYDSARESAWAFGTIYDDVYGLRGGDQKVRQTMAKLDKELKLKLPQGRGTWVEDDLDASLDAIKKYDPKAFRPLMQSLGSAFGKR
jgi:hypothetical protein